MRCVVEEQYLKNYYHRKNLILDNHIETLVLSIKHGNIETFQNLILEDVNEEEYLNGARFLSVPLLPALERLLDTTPYTHNTLRGILLTFKNELQNLQATKYPEPTLLDVFFHYGSEYNLYDRENQYHKYLEFVLNEYESNSKFKRNIDDELLEQGFANAAPYIRTQLLETHPFLYKFIPTSEFRPDRKIWLDGYNRAITKYVSTQLQRLKIDKVPTGELLQTNANLVELLEMCKTKQAQETEKVLAERQAERERQEQLESERQIARQTEQTRVTTLASVEVEINSQLDNFLGK